MRIKNAKIRTKLVLAVFGGAGLAGLCMIALAIVFIIASENYEVAMFFNKHILAFVLLFFVIFVMLMMFFYVMLIKNKIRYLEEITSKLEIISHGNFEIDLPLKGSDELGAMAETVNLMASKLKDAREEERKLEKAKNDLIANISHDLRTPLTSTLGYLELIRKTDTNREENLSRYVDIALRKCKELKVLIDKLFEYSKLNNVDSTTVKSNISIGELLEQVIMGFMPALKEAGMEYRLFFSDDKLIVNADPMLLIRVFDNLISNAINYGKKGKYLDIELSKAEGEAVVKVINYGNPISKEDLPFLFERYYQAKTNAPRKGSSGLGLAIVKRIVDIHDGRIVVLSADDKTVFQVNLRISEQ